jgi:Tol biopolymer transport system component
MIGLAVAVAVAASAPPAVPPQLLVERVRTGRTARHAVLAVRPNGRVVRTVVRGKSVSDVRWAPDAKRLVATRSRGEDGEREDVVLLSPRGRVIRRLTTDGRSFAPVWSPDGRWIAYARRGRGERGFLEADLWRVRRDGTGRRRVLDPGANVLAVPSAWSPDGALIAYTRAVIDEQRYAAPDGIQTAAHAVTPDGQDDRVLADDAGTAAWSPDGRLLAFSSVRDRNGTLSYGDRESYATELYVADADGANPRRLTRTEDVNEDQPAWSPDSDLIAFQRGEVVDNAQGTWIALTDALASCAPDILRDRRLDTWYSSPTWHPGSRGEVALGC